MLRTKTSHFVGRSKVRTSEESFSVHRSEFGVRRSAFSIRGALRFEADDRERRQGGDLANALRPLNAER